MILYVTLERLLNNRGNYNIRSVLSHYDGIREYFRRLSAAIQSSLRVRSYQIRQHSRVRRTSSLFIFRIDVRRRPILFVRSPMQLPTSISILIWRRVNAHSAYIPSCASDLRDTPRLASRYCHVRHPLVDFTRASRQLLPHRFPRAVELHRCDQELFGETFIVSMDVFKKVTSNIRH